MEEKKVTSLEEIDERDDDNDNDTESLTYTNDSVSMGSSIKFRLTQTKRNLGEKLNNLS